MPVGVQWTKATGLLKPPPITRNFGSSQVDRKVDPEYREDKEPLAFITHKKIELVDNLFCIPRRPERLSVLMVNGPDVNGNRPIGTACRIRP